MPARPWAEKASLKTQGWVSSKNKYFLLRQARFELESKEVTLSNSSADSLERLLSACMFKIFQNEILFESMI